MSMELPPEIESGLVSLRRRIRRIQLFRGLLRTFGVILGGLLLIIALDYFLAPLPSWTRGGLFFLWLAAMLVAGVLFVLRPLMGKLPLIRLARWLEARHPETQERISTALELAEHPEGISSDLLAELSREAALDISMVDPNEEVQTKRIRRSMLPVGAALLALISLVAVWPREMGRLLTRAVSPFSELGNAGAFRFEIQPGDVELLEGDELAIRLTYSGSLQKPLELVIEKDGGVLAESLQPASSDGDTHTYSYKVHSAEAGFHYSARVAGSESDRFEVKVFPLPRLLDPVVTLQFPPYTAWPDREMSLGNGVQALAGTEVTIKGRFDTPLESAELLMDAAAFGQASLESSARGTDMTWTGIFKPGLDATAVVKVKHRLGRELDASQFNLRATEDPAPLVKILTPVQREFRVKPDEQVIITYEVVEGIGLAKAEIELEVNGKSVAPLMELLPERIDGEGGRLWEGEAMIFLGSLVSEHQGARSFRMRLALSDNRPAELDGPGVGHSEWLEFKLDNNAESLARQELRKQDSDIRESVEKAVRDIEQARSKMHQAKNEFHKEEITERTEKALTEAREKLKEAQKDLSELSERMKQGIQAHRRDVLEEVIAKLDEAKNSVEKTTLQDSPEARHSEVDHALRESQEAVDDLRQFQREVQKDQPKTEDLARLQELAQRQEELARQASENEPDQEWKNKQRQMQEEIRQKVQQSPEAKAAAMKSQSEQALDLAKEAEALEKSQDALAKLAQQSDPANPKMDENQLHKAIAQEQNDIAREAREELAEARRDEDQTRMADLPKAISEAEKAANEVSQAKPEEAAKSAQKAAEELAKGAEENPSQQAVQKRQEKVAEVLDALAKGRPKEAQAAFEEMKSDRVSDALEQALAREQEAVVEGAKAELSEARAAQEARANDLPEALAQAESALSETQKGDPKAAAQAAQQAARELSKGAELSPSQMALQEKQQEIAEALQDLADGQAAEALAALEEIQAGRAAELAQDIQSIAEVEGNTLGQAQQQAMSGSQKAANASQAQQAGQAQQASQHHQQASQKFGEASRSLAQASQQMAKQAEQASQQAENANKAPAPGEQMAEALQQSAEANKAGQAGQAQKAAASAQAAAEALRQAANEAKASMKQGSEPGQERAQADEAGEPGKGEQASDEAKEGMREAQGDKGVPPELAKLGISASDWEKIQATMTSDVSGSRRSVIPEDYRGLVQKYFEQVTKKR